MSMLATSMIGADGLSSHLALILLMQIDATPTGQAPTGGQHGRTPSTRGFLGSGFERADDEALMWQRSKIH